MERARNPSPLAMELIPKLVPESDDGNVEYKLQLLDPSPGRFARLVTQLKWRLLEGGGQAYYELGVADSGDLIGLSRDELEKSLETLEMMAGEIGASVIVVKEIEVPAGLATLAGLRKEKVSDAHGTPSSLSSTEGGYSSNTSATTIETDLDSLSGTDLDECQKTIVPSNGFSHDETLVSMFTMDSEAEDTPNATEEEVPTSLPSQFYLEISAVFKPRPMKPRLLNTSHLFGGKNKRNKKFKQVDPAPNTKQDSQKGNGAQKIEKALQRRQNRDKRREEKRKNLEAQAMLPVDVPHGSTVDDNSCPPGDVLVDSLKMLHVSVLEELQPSREGNIDTLEDDNDLFTAKPGLSSLPSFTTSESHLDVDPAAIASAVGVTSNKEHKTLIVEALVVRKISYQEAFLDFEGFSVS